MTSERHCERHSRDLASLLSVRTGVNSGFRIRDRHDALIGGGRDGQAR